MKHSLLFAMMATGFVSVAHADLSSDLSTLCNADQNMNPQQCDCQIKALTNPQNVNQDFLKAMVDGLKNKNTEPLMQLMQNDQEGANKFGRELERITRECGSSAK